MFWSIVNRLSFGSPSSVASPPFLRSSCSLEPPIRLISSAPLGLLSSGCGAHLAPFALAAAFARHSIISRFRRLVSRFQFPRVSPSVDQFKAVGWRAFASHFSCVLFWVKLDELVVWLPIGCTASKGESYLSFALRAVGCARHKRAKGDPSLGGRKRMGTSERNESFLQMRF